MLLDETASPSRAFQRSITRYEKKYFLTSFWHLGLLSLANNNRLDGSRDATWYGGRRSAICSRLARIHMGRKLGGGRARSPSDSMWPIGVTFVIKWGLMASAEREPITGVLGQSPQRGPVGSRSQGSALSFRSAIPGLVHIHDTSHPLSQCRQRQED